MKITINNTDFVEEKACGKLYIAGEYAILTPGLTAIVKSVNIYMNAQIRFSEKYKIYSDMYNYSVSLEHDENYSLIQETVNVVNKYLHIKSIDTKPFELNITGKMEKEGKKYGIGSSGSVVILTIKAMVRLHKYCISKDTIFKLAAYVLLKRGDNGSMGDLACIAYEELVAYISFDREKIKEKIENETFEKVINSDWGYKIEVLKCKHDYEFLVGWTGKPAISKDMINNVKKSINKDFLEKSDENVKNIIKGIKSGNKELIKEAVIKSGDLLKNLDSSIYSNELTELVNAAKELDMCAKSSGAGGGDCGIAISFNKNDTKTVIEKWEKKGIVLLYRGRL